MTTQTKSLFENTPVQILLVITLVIASFFLGSMYTKVKYLEGGKPTTAAPSADEGTQAKYKTFEDALKAIAKQASVDEKKLLACVNSGQKKSIVDADSKQAESLGVGGTPAFFINGIFLGGAFPFESFKEIIDMELAGGASKTVADYSQTLQDAAKGGAFDPSRKQTDPGQSAATGPTDAPITIIEFSDFQCPFCARGYQTVKQIESEYGDKVRIIYKHLPLISIHPHAYKASEAAECAGEQGKFWEFHDALYDTQSDWASTPS